MTTGGNCKFAVKQIVTTAEKSMAAFDTLPAEVRAMLREHPLKISAEVFLDEIKRGRTKAQLEVALEQAVAREWSGEAMGRVWGPGHPQARGATAQACKVLRLMEQGVKAYAAWNQVT